MKIQRGGHITEGDLCTIICNLVMFNSSKTADIKTSKVDTKLARVNMGA